MEPSDKLQEFPETPTFSGFRSEMLPFWVRAIGYCILLTAILSLFGIPMASLLISAGKYNGVIYTALLSGYCLVCGGAAWGLLMDKRWGLPAALYTAYGIIALIIAFLVFDGFFARGVNWGLIAFESCVGVAVCFYIRVLRKLRYRWSCNWKEDIYPEE